MFNNYPNYKFYGYFSFIFIPYIHIQGFSRSFPFCPVNSSLVKIPFCQVSQLFQLFKNLCIKSPL